ncbi:hypothetical protein SAMN02746041_01424 [Desulfacinum hydrothermale DSM 13146]|uniref:Thioredoxin-like fold domain-containing protein n=1 Tax=Desulfacinum hydrothermale DSM 13146 TaxID=1121390 RepID=A0A1W1XEN9_9BACT|nr:thioredoxin family protein [Desulfacinum hydrothermale]SMC22403.1 hypothetical protein SAMN02746041_01424 [Desulfacinum hydrothermale DSM 13146]
MRWGEREKEIVRAWSAHVTASVHLSVEKTLDARSAKLEDFARELARLVPKVSVEVLERESDDLPALLPGAGWIFHGVPDAAELRPFLEILALSTQPTPPPLDRDLLSMVASLESPRELTLYVTPHCPHCAHTLFDLAPLPLASPRLLVRVIDADSFPEQARSLGIRAVPTLLLGETFRWTGQVRIREVLEVVCREEGGALSAAATIRLLKEGKAEDVARLMARSDRAWQDFPRILTHPEWSVRLGALVVLEELAEARPDLARSHLSPLWDRMDGAHLSVQGDILYAIGLAGDRSWISVLERWLEENDPGPDLLEVAREALEKLDTDPQVDSP